MLLPRVARQHDVSRWSHRSPGSAGSSLWNRKLIQEGRPAVESALKVAKVRSVRALQGGAIAAIHASSHVGRDRLGAKIVGFVRLLLRLCAHAGLSSANRGRMRSRCGTIRRQDWHSSRDSGERRSA